MVIQLFTTPNSLRYADMPFKSAHSLTPNRSSKDDDEQKRQQRESSIQMKKTKQPQEQYCRGGMVAGGELRHFPLFGHYLVRQLVL